MGTERRDLTIQQKLLEIVPEAKQKYTTSATEQEIIIGALKVENAQEHVFGYFRNIEGISEDESSTVYKETDKGIQNKIIEAVTK